MKRIHARRSHSSRAAKLLMCLLAAPGPVTAISGEETHQTIRVGFYENRPKIHTGAQGEYTGFFPAVMETIAEVEGWKIEYVPGSWNDGLDRLSRNEIDIMPDVALSPQRQQLYEFNEETVLLSWAAVYTRPDLHVQSFPELAGKRIALLKGGIYSEGPSSIREILKQFEITATFLNLDSYEEVFRAINNGKADVGVVNNIFGSYLSRSYRVVQTPMLFSPAQLRFAFPRRSANASNLIARIDAHLRTMKQNPQSAYYRALDKHLYGMPRTAAIIQDDNRDFLSPAEQEWISRHPVIRMGIDPEFFPFVFRDEQGRMNGIGADYAQLLNARLGIQLVDSEPMPWADAVEALKTGGVDVLPCVGRTEERTEFALFTKAFIDYQRVILTKIDTPFIAGMDDIANMRVGVQAKSSHEGFILENSAIEPVRFETLQDTLAALSAGEIDAMVGNLASATYWIRRLNLLNIKIAAPVGDEMHQLHFAVRKDWPELVTILDKGLDLITPEEKQAIRNQWIAIDFTPGIAPHIAWRYGLRIAGVIILVIAAILLWTYRLKKEVARRQRVEGILKFRVGFERLITEISSRFIGVMPEDVDKQIQLSLTELACFTGSTAGYVYVFDPNGKPIRVHAGGDLNELEKIRLHPDDDHADSPWRERIRSGKPLIAYAQPPEQETPSALLSPSPPWLQSGSMLEVPYHAENKVAGFFGLIDKNGHIPLVRDEDTNLLHLLGQIFYEALRHKKTEESLRQYTLDLALANQRLQDLDRLKSLFIASVSHELRTP